MRPYESRSAAARLYENQGPSARARALDAAKGLLPFAPGAALNANLKAAQRISRFGLTTHSLTGSLIAAPAGAWGNIPGSAALSWLAGGVAGGGLPEGAPGATVPGAAAAVSVYSTMSAAPPEPPLIELSRGSHSGIPAGFIEVANDADAARVRAQIAAQNSLHGWLGASGFGGGAIEVSASEKYETAKAQYSAAASRAALAATSVKEALALAANTSANASNLSRLSQPQVIAAIQTAGIRLGGPQLTINPFAGAGAAPVGGSDKDAVAAALAAAGGSLVTVGGDSATGIRADVLNTSFAGAMLALPVEALGSGVRTSAAQREAGIAYEAAARSAIRSAILTQANIAEAMDVTESTLTYGMFLLSLAYFRIMNQLARLKTMGTDASTQRAAAEALAGPPGAKGGSSNLGLSAATTGALTEERKRIETAEKLKLHRLGLKSIAFAKAASWYAAAVARRSTADEAARQIAIRKHKREARRVAAVLSIQRAWRGHRVRRTLMHYGERKALFSEFEALRIFAATRIQAVWRGYIAKQVVAAKRAELAAFLRHTRAKDAAEVGKMYYELHPLHAMVANARAAAAARGGDRIRADVRAARMLDDAAAVTAMRIKTATSAGGVNGGLSSPVTTGGSSAGKLGVGGPKGPEAVAAAAAAAGRVVRGPLSAAGALAAAADNLTSRVTDPYAPSGGVGMAAIAAADGEGHPRHIDLDALGVDDAYFKRRPPKVVQDVLSSTKGGGGGGGAASNHSLLAGDSPRTSSVPVGVRFAIPTLLAQPSHLAALPGERIDPATLPRRVNGPPSGMERGPALAAVPYYRNTAPSIALEATSVFQNMGIEVDATARLPVLADGRAGAGVTMRNYYDPAAVSDAMMGSTSAAGSVAAAAAAVLAASGGGGGGGGGLPPPAYLQPLPRTRLTIPNVSVAREAARLAQERYMRGDTLHIETAEEIAARVAAALASDNPDDVPITARSLGGDAVGRRTTLGEMQLEGYAARRAEIVASAEAAAAATEAEDLRRMREEHAVKVAVAKERAAALAAGRPISQGPGTPATGISPARAAALAAAAANRRGPGGGGDSR